MTKRNPNVRRSMLYGAVLAIATVGLIACSGTAEDAGDVPAGSAATNLIPTEQPPATGGPATSTSEPAGAAANGAISVEESDANGNRPTDVVRNLREASVKADCETLAESLAGWDEEALTNCRANRKPTPDPATVQNVEFEGFYPDPDPARPDMEPGTAVVIVNMDYKQGPAEWEHWLRLEDGAWKVYTELDPVFLN
jgi:hypothetical protein